MFKHATCLLATGTLFLAACGETVTAPDPQLDDADVEFPGPRPVPKNRGARMNTQGVERRLPRYEHGWSLECGRAVRPQRHHTLVGEEPRLPRRRHSCDRGQQHTHVGP